MSKYDLIHDFYEKSKILEFSDTAELMGQAKDEEEKDFIALITDFVLQQKQKRVIAEKRF